MILVVQVIASDAQVRWYIGPLGSTVLNVTLFGLPLYGSFGALSLASLIVLHMFVIGAAFLETTRGWQQYVLAVGFGAAVFLVLGSNARSVQLVFPYLLLALGLAAALGGRQVRIKLGVLLAVAALAAGYSSSRMVEQLRLVSTIRQMLGLSVPPDRFHAEIARRGKSAKVVYPDIEKLSTGRKSLLEDAFREVALSPVFGTGLRFVQSD